MRRGLDRPSGITLIELLVALAIVGILFVVGVTALRGALDVDLKSSSRELASLIRYLRTKAVTENKYLRLVLDLENSRYWVEESENPYVISPGEEVPASPSKAEGFQKLDERLARQRSLPSGVFFKDVVVSYSKEKQEKGEAFLYFFPDGFATRSMINLRDEEDKDHYSLEVFPLSGRVVVTGEYREMEEG